MGIVLPRETGQLRFLFHFRLCFSPSPRPGQLVERVGWKVSVAQRRAMQFTRAGKWKGDDEGEGEDEGEDGDGDGDGDGDEDEIADEIAVCSVQCAECSVVVFDFGGCKGCRQIA